MKKVSIFLLTFLIVLGITVPSYAKRLKRCDYYYYDSSCWMPDSKHIIYVKWIRHVKYSYSWLAAVTKSGVAGAGADWYICKMNIDTKKENIIAQFSIGKSLEDKHFLIIGEKKERTYKMMTVGYIDCASNGKLLCFISGDGIYTMNIDGSGLKKISDGGREPRFSPDSKQILFGNYKDKIDEKGRVGKEIGLWLMNVDGSNKRLLAEKATHGIWHPSGEKIAYHIEKENGSTYIMNLKTKETRVLTTKKCGPSDWSPDGKYINFISTSRDMSGKRAKTGFKDIPEYGRFSPDGLKMLGGNDGEIALSKIGDEKETILLENYSRKY